jgi:transposase
LGHYKQARKLANIIKSNPITKPIIKTISPELDSRMIKINLDNKTSFDGWVIIQYLGDKDKIYIPIKKHSHLNELLIKGKLKSGIRLNKNSIDLNFELIKPTIKSEGKIIGLDIGQTNVFTTSDNQFSVNDKDNWNLTKINNKLSKKKWGSKGFKRTQNHRKNYINWTINQLNLDGIKKIKLENIKNLKKHGKLKFWLYPLIFDKVGNYCLENGVQIEKINPTYTSQRCSACGWVRKANRNGKLFKCKSCNFLCDADLNASINISLELVGITKKQRLSRANLKGFYWLVQDSLGAYSP